MIIIIKFLLGFTTAICVLVMPQFDHQPHPNPDLVVDQEIEFDHRIPLDNNYFSFLTLENFKISNVSNHPSRLIPDLKKNFSSRSSRQSENQGLDSHLVTRWSFESNQSPLKDTAPAGQSKDTLSVFGSVKIEDGIAKFPTGEEGVGLRASPSMDLSPGAGMTLWARLRVHADPNGSIWLFDKGSTTNRDRSYGMYLTPDVDKDYQLAVNTKLSSDGMDWMKMSSSGGGENPPAGLWIQIAMIIWKEGPMMKSVVAYRTEHTSRPNPWKLLYKSSRLQTLHNSDTPFFIGNNAEMNELSTELWVDEVKLYDRALSLKELKNSWAILGAYPEVPTDVPGTVIAHTPAETGKLDDPSIVIMPDGTYVAKFYETSTKTTKVYHSYDKGKNWKRITNIENLRFTNIFFHNQALYLMGTDLRGHCVIKKSEDGGHTWTTPQDENSGLLLFNNISYHTAPMQMIKHNGRIWRTMEDLPREHWGIRFQAFMMSAPIDSNLLKASSWTTSDRLGYNPAWLDGKFRGWLEGNAVVDPNGKVINVLRADNRPDGGKAAIIHYSEDGERSFFDPDKDFIDLPGGNKKFFIRYDDESGYYWALSSIILPKHASGNLEKARDYVSDRIPPSGNPGGVQAFTNPERTRNTLALMTSRDLRNWTIRKIVLYHPDLSKYGFQYPHYIFEGDDIIFVSRTAHDDGQGGAQNQHDANFITFHRIKDFRSLAIDD